MKKRIVLTCVNSSTILCPGLYAKLGIPNLACVSLMSSYQMLQSSKFTTFTIAKLFWDNQQENGIYPNPTQTCFHKSFRHTIKLLEGQITSSSKEHPVRNGKCKLASATTLQKWNTRISALSTWCKQSDNFDSQVAVFIQFF